MEAYRIYIDASVDIDNAYLEENDIRIIPMTYTVDGVERRLTKRQTDEEAHAYYELMKNDTPVSTSQITPFEYETAFEAEAAAGESILYISLSAGLSNTYSSALMAIGTLKERYGAFRAEAVDSAAGTGGMGLLLMLAVKNRAQGMGLVENADFLREHALRICHWFMVEDLKYLKRGGRISPTTAFVGEMLNIKPILQIDDDGRLITISKQRGSAKAVKYLLSRYEASHDDALGSDVIIAHADVPERAARVKEALLEINPQAKVQICSLSLIIGSHTGPGMVAVIHFGDRNCKL